VKTGTDRDNEKVSCFIAILLQGAQQRLPALPSTYDSPDRGINLRRLCLHRFSSLEEECV